MNKLMIIILVMMPMMTLQSQMKQGDNLLGASIGLWTKGNTPVLGVNFESEVAGSSTGTIGIGGLYRYHGYNENVNDGYTRNYNFSSIGFQANYNFTGIGTGEFVPYVGLTLGYNNVTNSYSNGYNGSTGSETYSSGAWIWGQLGARYFFSSKVAGTLRVGLGNNDFYPLELGVDFKL